MTSTGTSTGTSSQPSLTEAADAVRRAAVEPTTLVEEALEAAHAGQALNAIAYLDEQGARAEARQQTEEQRAGRSRGPLHGVPLTVKDLYAVPGAPMKAGSRAPLPDDLRAAVAGADEAEAVARLRNAGAIVFGTTQLVEMAFGVHGENPAAGDVHNPHDPGRQCGGSSSGSAAAVAAGIGYASLGSDTAGSVRVPAALCGVVGAKPTIGSVPLTGALPLAPTCDHGGPLARTVADAALLLQVLAGRPVSPLVPSRPRRIGVLTAYTDGALGTAERKRYEELLAHITDTGVEIVELAPEELDGVLPAYTSLVRAEAAHVHRNALDSAPERFTDAVRAPLLAGREVSAVDYLEARRKRALLRGELVRVLAEVDAMLVPTNPVVAQPLGTTEVELESGRTPHRDAFLRLTVPFSFVGVPAVSIPYATVDELPLGVQVVTGFGADDRGLAVAGWLESLLREVSSITS